MNKNTYSLKDIITYALIGTIVFFGILSVPMLKLQNKFESVRDSNENQVHLDSFSDGYTNNSDEDIKIRYKYTLTHEKADSVIPGNWLSISPEVWNNEVPLFYLYENGLLVSEGQVYPEFSEIVPDVSATYTLKPGETSEIEFSVMTNKEIEEIKDLIRFEVGIVVEELKGGRWSPAHQVNFMERGPYWSLNRGPIELEPIE